MTAEELIAAFEQQVALAGKVCATRRPEPGAEAYMIGYAQGRYAGLVEGLKLLTTAMEDDDMEDDETTEGVG